jgi:hypothetical protein
VVAAVEGRAGLAAKHDCFLLCLEDFGAGEEAARGNAVFEEGGVVGAAAVDGRCVVELLAVEEGLKVLLDRVGAGWA